MKTLLSIILIVLLAQTQLIAQNTAEDYLGSWYTLGINHKFTEHFSITPYAELHLYETASNYNLTFASLSGNYHFKPNQTISIAYAFLDIDSVIDEDNQPNTKENRIYEQYSYLHKTGRFSIQHRFRLEQRFLKLADQHNMQNRLRYRLGLKYPINTTLFLALKDEPFVNFQDQMFHENRFFIGIGFNLLKNTILEVDYFKHHINKNNLNRIQISITINTNSKPPKAISTPL
ncbi:DUF2490 domain-containing protein [Winogradskyella helgolandensis]|uniref:DUF2490 domain-containing protein n=1 Tax=Winogradskyella helgolandensis TaxID=2697010 RepID=UPI0015C0255B|nr:DUF2490 domain-containing protein [Winogradskyella helgolandensis]